MISLPFRPARNPSIDALYGAIVAQARLPAFYRDDGVPDTVAGRMDMIVLHLVLVLRRLRAVSAPGPAMGQGLFDRFCRDMDANFREMGVGDLAVPKKMREVAEAFYGRTKVYEAALADGDEAALSIAVARNVFGLAEPTLGVLRLTAYMREAARTLDALTDDALAHGKAGFPDPEAAAAPRPDGERNR